MKTLITLLMTCALAPSGLANYSGGSGTPEDPYQIATAADLIALGETPKDYDKHFVLTADIDLDPNLPGGRVFDKAVIAPDTDPAPNQYGYNVYDGTAFTGVLDGSRHTIRNLKITGRQYLGLFGRLDPPASVSNLGLEAVEVSGTGYAGGLVGRNDGSVIASYSSGFVNGAGTGWYAGGLVGYNDGSISASFSSGAVSGAGPCVGGLVGGNGGHITDSDSRGSVRGTDDVGGLAGWNNGRITASFSSGPVSGDRYVGGLVGTNYYGALIVASYSSGSVSGDRYVGGLAGQNHGRVPLTRIAGSYSHGSVSGKENVGGLVGSNGGGSITLSFWDIQTSGQSWSAGGAGLTTAEMMDPQTLGLNGFANDLNWVLDVGRDYPRLAWEGTPGSIVPEANMDWLTGQGTADSRYQIDTADQLILLSKASLLWSRHFVLGDDLDLDPALPGRHLFGQAVIPYFTGVFDGAGHVISRLTIQGAGNLGLFGYLAGRVSNIGVVDVNITGSYFVGGLAGRNDRYISDSYSNGSVRGTRSVGGLAGSNDGVITSSSSSGSVFGSERFVGGLVGSNGDRIDNSYSTSSVRGTDRVGGLVGTNGEDSRIVTSCSTGAVVGTSSVGGLAGANRGWTTDSYSTGSVCGTDRVGGLVGDNEEGYIVTSYSSGSVIASNHVGGLVGYEGDDGDYGIVQGSFWDIQTSGQPTSAGGTGITTAEMQTVRTFLTAGWDFVGETANGTEDTWKVVEGLGYPRLSWERYSGGTGEPSDPYEIATAADLITLGETPDDYDKHFVLTADIDLDPRLPGGTVFNKAVIAPGRDPVPSWLSEGTAFAGVVDGAGHTISHLTIIGQGGLGLFGHLGPAANICHLGLEAVKISGTSFVGSLAGLNEGTIRDCHSTGLVSGEEEIGGLVGRSPGRIERCSFTGTVEGQSEVGGLAGVYGKIESSCFAGTVTGSDHVGGLVGEHGGRISNCFATGGVLGNDHVGGLVGYNDDGIILNSYSQADVSGGDYVGGLVGSNIPDEDLLVECCYAAGAVAGTGDHVGGLIGYGCGSATSFWDIQTSGRMWSVGGTGLTTAQMQDPGTFMVMGWDFVGLPDGPHDIWISPEGGGYPILWWQQSPPPDLPAFSGGTGQIDDPYLISTAQDLNSIGHNPRLMKCHFRLVENLDLAGFQFHPIGDRDFLYAGVFEGNGHTVAHLTINGSSYVGLFGRLKLGAAIRDLSVVDVNIAGSGPYVGGLAGASEGGSISACDCSGTVRGISSYVGGFVGWNSGTIRDCQSTGVVSGEEDAAGLVGFNTGAISDCHSMGVVSADDGAGGLVVYNMGNIASSHSSATVNGGGGIGGLVGWNGHEGSISSSYSTGAVRGGGRVGGLVGDNRGSVLDSYSTGSVSGSYSVGGLVGVAGWGTIAMSFSSGSVNGNEDVGGLVGEEDDGIVTGCFWDTQTSGRTTSGGGTGKTTAEMQTTSTFLEAGWDFVGETANGTKDIWWIDEGKDYPRLWWELSGKVEPDR